MLWGMVLMLSQLVGWVPASWGWGGDGEKVEVGVGVGTDGGLCSVATPRKLCEPHPALLFTAGLTL